MPKKIKILFCAMKYDYGETNRGYSYEYYNYLPTFKKQGHEVLSFDYMGIYKKLGKDKMNDLLYKTFKKFKPHLFFCSLFQDQIKKDVIATISNSKTTTFTWFYDDSWRFQDYCKDWGSIFNWVGTTEEYMVKKYQKSGQKNAIYLPFAVNPKIYKPYKLHKTYNVTFVGGPHGFRNNYYNYLKSKNIKVNFFGQSWSGRLSFQDMVKLFSKSKISLNFTETSYQGNQMFFYLRRFNLLPKIKQHKARIFEIPACGGFELSGWTRGIEKLYEPGKEIEVFKSKSELLEKCHYFIKANKHRERIAKAGLLRTLNDHTYEKRFNYLFKSIGLV